MQTDRWPEKNLRSNPQYTEDASTGMDTAVGHYKSSFQSRPDRCSVRPSAFLPLGMLRTFLLATPLLPPVSLPSEAMLHLRRPARQPKVTSSTNGQRQDELGC